MIHLRSRQLDFAWPNRLLFHDWQADIGAGLTWLHGPNGCGKSTLLKLLAAALPAQRGLLRLEAHAPGAAPVQIDLAAPGEPPLDWRRAVVWCPPEGPVFDHLKAPEYFGFLAGLYPRFDAAALAQHIDGFQLALHTRLPIARLSSGTRRKIGLAAALASGARVLLLDEPLNALDEASTTHLCQTLQLLHQQSDRVCLVASHQPLAGLSATRLSLSDAG